MKLQLLLLSGAATLATAQQDLPRVKLPYGTWQAAKYDRANDIYVFKNIRFGAPPTGPLRWAKPAPPATESTLQLGRKGPSCLSSISSSLMAMGDGFNSGGKAGKGGQAKGGKGKGGLGGMLGGADVGALMNKMTGASEDCLFLDVYVPGKALKAGAAKLPVVNWIYGGAYLIGDKNYDGSAVVKASGNNVVYVGGNYRLGLLGWLAGDTMEKQATPNAALWDQRAVLEWIQKYISLFGGDPAEVSLWGESAGAGSITHHLIAHGGKATGPALFKRAVIMSPAYDYHVERRGHLEKQYKEFEEYAGCKGKGVACLRAASIDVLTKAQKKQLDQMPGGKPGAGPAADGVLIRQAAPLEFAAGHVVPGIESIILSHTLDEGKIFVPADTSDKTFEAVIKLFWSSSNATLAAVRKQYAVSRFSSPFERFRQMYNHGTFLCATRYIAEAYKGKTWNMVYSQGAGTHGADIAAAFYKGNAMGNLLNPGFGRVAATYQSYLTSHARAGDPNKYRSGAGNIEWPKVGYGPVFSNVLNVTNSGFALIKDDANTEADCAFWTKTLQGLTKAEGYEPK